MINFQHKTNFLLQGDFLVALSIGPSLARQGDFPVARFSHRPEFGPPGGFLLFNPNGPSLARQGDFSFFQTS